MPTQKSSKLYLNVNRLEKKPNSYINFLKERYQHVNVIDTLLSQYSNNDNLCILELNMYSVLSEKEQKKLGEATLQENIVALRQQLFSGKPFNLALPMLTKKGEIDRGKFDMMAIDAHANALSEVSKYCHSFKTKDSKELRDYKLKETNSKLVLLGAARDNLKGLEPLFIDLKIYTKETKLIFDSLRDVLISAFIQFKSAIDKLCENVVGEVDYSLLLFNFIIDEIDFDNMNDNMIMIAILATNMLNCRERINDMFKYNRVEPYPELTYCKTLEATGIVRANSLAYRLDKLERTPSITDLRQKIAQGQIINNKINFKCLENSHNPNPAGMLFLLRNYLHEHGAPANLLENLRVEIQMDLDDGGFTDQINIKFAKPYNNPIEENFYLEQIYNLCLAPEEKFQPYEFSKELDQAELEKEKEEAEVKKEKESIRKDLSIDEIILTIFQQGQLIDEEGSPHPVIHCECDFLPDADVSEQSIKSILASTLDNYVKNKMKGKLQHLINSVKIDVIIEEQESLMFTVTCSNNTQKPKDTLKYLLALANIIPNPNKQPHQKNSADNSPVKEIKKQYEEKPLTNEDLILNALAQDDIIDLGPEHRLQYVVPFLKGRLKVLQHLHERLSLDDFLSEKLKLAEGYEVTNQVVEDDSALVVAFKSKDLAEKAKESAKEYLKNNQIKLKR